MARCLFALEHNKKHNITKNLNIPINNQILEDVLMIQSPIIAAIEKYKRDTSILKIKKQIRIKN